MRGSLRGNVVAGRLERSIPACAGQPEHSATAPVRSGVYPRVCGAAVARHTDAEKEIGLSPRVRGSRHTEVVSNAGSGSIPACAGQPSTSSRVISLTGVYPRVCGAAKPSQCRLCRAQGLSPRVRGSLLQKEWDEWQKGSIPACAGQPAPDIATCAPCTVYPRVCGAAVLTGPSQLARCGLSPRVRGSPLPYQLCVWQRGSIPACAGQPGFVVAQDDQGEVYPRVCGAAPRQVDMMRVLQFVQRII